jgi:hypothetical protein
LEANQVSLSEVIGDRFDDLTRATKRLLLVEKKGASGTTGSAGWVIVSQTPQRGNGLHRSAAIWALRGRSPRSFGRTGGVAHGPHLTAEQTCRRDHDSCYERGPT